jgi:hypothetical protein
MIKTPPRGERATPPAELELDQIFDSLAHVRRRYLLYTLLDDGEESLWERASKIAAWEEDVAENSLSEEAIEQVYLMLYHAHVPKLVGYEIIEFDAEDESIRSSTNTDRVLSVLMDVADSTSE